VGGTLLALHRERG